MQQKLGFVLRLDQRRWDGLGPNKKKTLGGMPLCSCRVNCFLVLRHAAVIS